MMAFLRSRALASGVGRLAKAPAIADPQRHGPTSAVGPSVPGRTWNGGLGIPFWLEPGQSRTIRVLLAWHFPNRYVNFEQFGPERPQWGHSRFWLGNQYTTRFPDVRAVREEVTGHWDELRDATLAWTDTFAASTLDGQAVEHLAAQLSLIRSPTCFRTADGRFFGFEGTLGASTAMWSGEFGGSCPLNCTHVWNYGHVLARAYPELERSMRETEFDIAQSPEGYVPHRIVAPVYLPQMWGETIGGPEEPALDGMLGTVLKTYRDYLSGSGDEWLRRYWPNVERLLEHIRGKWLEQATGLLIGIQPSTHDIDLCGVNSFMGTLWLAALRAAEEMAIRMQDTVAAGRYRAQFEQSSESYDRELFNGEYYEQQLRVGDSTDFQWVKGCLSDQLIGQWWAHQLGLGHLLPVEHVRSALQAVLKYNLRHGFRDFEHGFRVFADGDDSGLLMCTWPSGGRPAMPTRYADEVWTGSEYQVAAHCLWEGMDEQAWMILRAMWGRYDGRKRNPYNEIECGDHYVRAMAGWTVLESLTGFRHDVPTGRVFVRVPSKESAVPYLAATGWGLISFRDLVLEIDCRGGDLLIEELVIEKVDGGTVRLVGGGGRVDHADGDGRVTVRPDRAVQLAVGDRVRLALG